ncbi:methylamine utilization protein [Neorhodopirellula lusitana]|uniref:methylamine utilization protein n=1 Tax=Neorhodopirellula lusitana TaxID=445327 RepID=UPI0038509EE6
MRTQIFPTNSVIRRLSIAFAATACVSATLAAGTTSAQDATLKMRFVYDGTPPKVENIDPNKDAEYCGKHVIPNEKMLVNPDNKGMRNVIVHVYTRSSGKDLPKTEAKNSTHVLANDQCRFEPHVVVAQSGDKLRITNPDEVGHNANLNFIRNTAQNLMIPAGQEKLVDLSDAEPAPIPVDCNIHPWMRAYVVVLEHPFADVSDADGNIVIEGLPAGKEITFAVRYEGGKLDEVKVGGKETDWKRQRFEVDLKAGVNDLGEILVPASAVSAD